MGQTNQLISTAEAAEFLGIKMSYLHKLMIRRVIPYYKPNGKLCFFEKQRIGGNGQRDESDCRSHFYRWIIKRLNANRHGTIWKSAAYRDTESRLSQPRTTKGRFRLPFDEDTAAKLLKGAIEDEVCRFGGTFLYPDAVEAQIRSLSTSLTSGRRCGVMLL